MTTSTTAFLNSDGFRNPFCTTCRAYSVFIEDEVHGRKCEVCASPYNRLNLDYTKARFCNSCLIVTPHSNAVRCQCLLCNSVYSDEAPLSEEEQRVRVAAEAELNSMIALIPPTVFGQLPARGGLEAGGTQTNRFDIEGGDNANSTSL